jgi:hypothetical protein
MLEKIRRSNRQNHIFDLHSLESYRLLINVVPLRIMVKSASQYRFGIE